MRARRPELLRRGDFDARLRLGLFDFELFREAERVLERFIDDLREDLRLLLIDDFLFLDPEADLLLVALGVRLLRAALRLEDFRLALRLREPNFFGALGVRARRLDDLRLEVLLLEALGVLLLRAALLFEDRRLALRELDFFDFLGPFGVRARRFDDFRLELFFFEAFGVRLLRAAFRLEERRPALRERDLDFFGALGVFARRLDDFRLELFFLEALGVRLRRAALRLEERRLELRRLALRLVLFGALGVRARRLGPLRLVLLLLDAFRLELSFELFFLELFGVRLRFCFFTTLPLDNDRARFLMPISLLRFSFISSLYNSRPATHVL